jgi:hypothetical protein
MAVGETESSCRHKDIRMVLYLFSKLVDEYASLD